ncbi:MAG: hypothetical protein HQL66_04335 [Magnetococcales bacterium]|nr:hypothetical protein [Magnetococcales bacterium]
MIEQKRLYKQKGSMAVTALVLTAALAVVGLVVAKNYQSGKAADAQHAAGDKAFNLDEAAVQSVLSQLKAANCDPTQLSGKTMSGSDVVITQNIANQGSFTVTFHPTGTNTWSVTAAAVGNRRVTNFPGLSCSSSSSGTYAIDHLTLGNNATVTMAPGNYTIGTLTLGNNNNLVVSPSGVVKIYAQSTQIGNNASLNDGGSAGNLGIFAYTALQIGNNANIAGVLHAPSSAVSVQLGNNANLTGAVVGGGAVSLGNNDLLTYDASVTSALTSLGVSCVGGGGCPYPVVGNTSLAVGNNSQVSGHNVGSCGGGSCNVVTSTGARQSQTVSIPALAAFVASTRVDGNKSGGSLGPGQYDDITVGNNGAVTFTAGTGGGGGGGATIVRGTWKENF